MQDLTQLLSQQMSYAPQREAFQLYDEFSSDETRAVQLESYQTQHSAAASSLGDLDFVSKTVFNKLESLRIVINDIIHQISQRQKLESEIISNINSQVLGIRNQRLQMDSLRMQGEARPTMESALMQQQEILTSRIQDQRTLAFKEISLLKVELRQRFLELQESQSVLSGFREFM